MGRAERRAEQRVKKKDTTYIQQEKRWLDHNGKLIQKINAGIALALFRNHGFTKEQIVSVLSEGQNIWLADGVNDFNVIRTCLKEVGINIGSGRK